MKRRFIVLCILLFTAAPLWAEVVKMDPVVVTATRTGTPLSQIASSVTVITAAEIEAKQQTQVIDVLRSVPGVNIVQTGSRGGQTSVYLRGTDSRHTLILIDGIEYKDTASIGGIANIENLGTDNIAQIEIVRGAQSVLYGSDAIGGVINIITKTGARVPEGYVSVEGGSDNTWIKKSGVAAGSETTTFAASISRIDTDGFSAASEKDGNTEDDGFQQTAAALNLGIKPTDNFDFKLVGRVDSSEKDIDSFASGSFADSDAMVETDEKMGRAEGTFHLLDDSWQLTLGTAVTDTERTGTGTGWYDNYEFDGKTTKFDVKNVVTFGIHTIVFGAETEKEEYKSSTSGSGSARNDAIFIQDQLVVGNLSTAIGVRYDDHEYFGSETTWRIAPTYTLTATGTKVKGSIGTGFKAPSLFHLFYPYGGNENLNPESSMSLDVGIEQALFHNAFLVGVTWFYNDIDDYIDWYDDGDADWFDGDGYHNITSLKTSGIESTIEWYPNDIFSIKLNYTYTDSKEDNDSRKARIPLHKGSVDLNLYPTDKLQLNLNIVYSGKRDESNATTLAAYTVTNVATSYQLTDNFKVFARVENLFDEDYEEASGYGTAGLSGYAGAKLSF
ncbi:vitamin B12 transporter [Desulfuromusa kysingii]|uniref:Vitamin B12 transporter n=1 Tax=Desulfuromusa kysingii TaxID=37625 RepID=A0A1H3X263_9BACT|nr:TonB-dependent receptor [Desulfuromusa kysingii]SDZ93071.1 vitamin B12 transporter [Desulfuromusa kysingii]